VQLLETCLTCKGVGKVPLYLYAPVSKATLRRMTTEQVLWLCWNGTARERIVAEKEIARRERRG
jgi:hypothetical protein